MAVQSKRESILDYIKATTLALIDGTGHYNNNLKKITRRVVDPTNFDDTDLPLYILLIKSCMYKLIKHFVYIRHCFFYSGR